MISKTVLAELAGICGQDGVVAERDRLLAYESDGLTAYRHLPAAVVLPRTTRELCATIKTLAARGLAVVPRGAGTGLSGGAVAAAGEVIVGTARMDRILELDPANRRMRVQPGAINAELSAAAAPHGLHYAPDPSSQSACTVGGNVAENSGGPHCLKYGVTSRYVTGLSVALADGSLVEFGGMGKSMGGYDLTGLFVGSEGCFGIAAEIEVGLVPVPEGVRTLLAVFGSLEAAGQAVSAIVGAGMLPAAMEIVDGPTIRAVEASVFAAGYPKDAEAALVLEFDGVEAGLPEEAGRAREHCRAAGASEIREARDEAERAALWRGRKKAFGAMGRIAPDLLVQDATVPRTALPAVLRKISAIGRESGLKVANVFHAGDGNLHPNILFDRSDAAEMARVEKASAEIMQACVAAGGTITGEHGVGIDKKSYMPLVYGPDELRVMWGLRRAFDPQGVFNPGKVLPEESDPGRPLPEGSDSGQALPEAPDPANEAVRERPSSVGRTAAGVEAAPTGSSAAASSEAAPTESIAAAASGPAATGERRGGAVGAEDKPRGSPGSWGSLPAAVAETLRLAGLGGSVAFGEDPRKKPDSFKSEGYEGRFEALVGQAALEWAPGVAAAAVVFPRSTEEVQAVVASANETGVPVLAAGWGAWLASGGRAREPGIVLSTIRLDRLEPCDPADLTLEAGAGRRLGAPPGRPAMPNICADLGSQGQWLPLDTPGARAGTLGGLVATGGSGALAGKYGSVRDNVLGLEMVAGDGRRLRFGGRVVKNVAGYDLARLATGSRGSLAVLTRVSVRVFARPQADVFAEFRDRAGNALALAGELASTSLPLAALEARPAGPEEDDDCRLALRVVGNRAEVDETKRRLRSLIETRNAATAVSWLEGAAAATEFEQWDCWEGDAQLVVRLSALPSAFAETWRRARELSAALGGRCSGHVLQGTARVKVAELPPDTDSLVARLTETRSALEETGGGLSVTSAAPALGDKIRWTRELEGQAMLADRIKTLFDPRGVLAARRA